MCNLLHPFKCSFFSCSYGLGDASFGVYEKLLQRPFDWSNAISREGSSIFGEQSKIREPKDEFLSFGAHDSLSARARLSHVDHIPPINILQQRAQKNTMPINPTTNPPELKTLKRKASDHTTLDLDLSLKLNSKINDAEEGTLKNHEVDSTNLSLSLCSQLSSSSNPSSRLIKEAQQDRCDEQGKIMASTLDLTI